MENLATTMTKQEKFMYDYTFKFYISNNRTLQEATEAAEKKVQGMRKLGKEMKKIGFRY